MIRFPNLGIELEHVRSGVNILGLDVTCFGILAGLGLLVMAIITLLEVYWSRQNMDEYANLIVFGTISAIIGARGGYVLLRWDYFKEHLREIIAIRHGGFNFYGAVIAVSFVILFYGMIRKCSAGRVLDTCSIGMVAGQAVVAWGLFFNREGFGDYTNGLFAMQIPVDSVSYFAITEGMKKHIFTLEGQRFVQVHPLFLQEFLLCFLIVLLLAFCRKKKSFDGEIFLRYIFLYSIGQAILEGKRTDKIFFPGTHWNMLQIVAIIFVIVSLTMIFWGRKRGNKARLHRLKDREAR